MNGLFAKKYLYFIQKLLIIVFTLFLSWFLPSFTFFLLYEENFFCSELQYFISKFDFKNSNSNFKKCIIHRLFVHMRKASRNRLSNITQSCFISNSSIYFLSSSSWIIAIEIFGKNHMDQFRYILEKFSFFGFGIEFFPFW